MSLSWGDARWRTGFNGRSAWQDDSVDGWRTLFGAATSLVRSEANYANTRFLVSDKVNQVFVIGQDRVLDRPVIVVVSMSGRGQGSSVPVEMTFAQLWSLRDGKAVSLRDYATRAEALAAVGLSE